MYNAALAEVLLLHNQAIRPTRKCQSRILYTYPVQQVECRCPSRLPRLIVANNGDMTLDRERMTGASLQGAGLIWLRQVGLSTTLEWGRQ